MKTKIKISIIALGLLAMLISVPTASAETITTHCGKTTTTRINGYLELKGNDSASVWFEWGETTALGNSTTRETFTTDSNFSQPIYGLTPNKTYYYRAMGSSDSGTAQGQIKTFTVKCDTRDDDDGNDNRKPTVDIRADDTHVDFDDSTTVRWSSTHADTCRGSGGTSGWSGNRARSGSFNTGDLTRDVTFTIRCENENGSATDSVTISVDEEDDDDDNVRPTVTIWANPTSVVEGGSSTVSWSSNNADRCRGTGGTSGWNGSNRNRSGSFSTGTLSGSVTFAIRCENRHGSATDSVAISVYPKPIVPKPPVYIPPKPRPVGNPLIVVSSSVDRNQPIIPSLDNTNPCPGDEIVYTVTYQNVGTAGVSNLSLRVDLPYEVDYMYSTPSNPTRSGQTLIFNLGGLRPGASGSVSIRVHVRENARHGAPLNFPATLTYVDNLGFPQTVSANVSANVCPAPLVIADANAERVGPNSLGASVFGVGFLPENLFGWLLLIVLVLILILLLRHLFGPSPWSAQPRMITTTYGGQPGAQPMHHNYGNPPSNLPGSTTTTYHS